MIRFAIPYLFLTLAACTQFPELDGTITPNLESADFPDLVPLEELLAASAPVVEDPVETTQALDARIASLRARAAALQRREIVDQETQARLETARN